MHLLTPSGYMSRFWELVSDNPDSKRPLEDAFRSLESELSDLGVRRYNTYGSFRVGKHRRVKRAKFRPSSSVLS